MQSPRVLVAAALVPVGLAALGRLALIVVRIEGGSMRPAYQPRDIVLAIRPRLSRRIRQGDVVVVRVPRPAWRPGDALADAEVMLVKRVTTAPAGSTASPLTAEAAQDSGALWIEGDDPVSYDSRQFGAVQPSAVVGRVVMRLHPRFGREHRRPEG